MWAVNSVKINSPSVGQVKLSDGGVLDAVRGPEGASFRLLTAIGYLDITDTGHQTGGPHYWQLVINGTIYWYDGQGAIDFTFNGNGSYTVTGDDNKFTGQLQPFPSVSPDDAKNFDWMMQEKYIPYQNIPDEPGKTTAELKALGKQYFPFSPYSFELAMSVYDWTTADFTRIDFLNMFTYTGVSGEPQDMDSIANSIWTANWPPYTPQSADYMNSFMIVPANSLQEVQSKLADKIDSLKTNNVSEVNIIRAALRTMPRTSVIAKPALYSGQVAIANLGTSHFATYFSQLPNNSDSSQPPLEMDISEAVKTFMAQGDTITLKSFMSFTDSREDAMHYSNGILISVIPPDGAVVWEQATYIHSPVRRARQNRIPVRRGHDLQDSGRAGYDV